MLTLLLCQRRHAEFLELEAPLTQRQAAMYDAAAELWLVRAWGVVAAPRPITRDRCLAVSHVALHALPALQCCTVLICSID